MHSTKTLLYSSIFIAEVYTALAAPNLTYRTIPNSDYSSVTETMGPKNLLWQVILIRDSSKDKVYVYSILNRD